MHIIFWLIEPKILSFVVLTPFLLSTITLLKWPRDVTCDQKILCFCVYVSTYHIFFWYSSWNVIHSLLWKTMEYFYSWSASLRIYYLLVHVTFSPPQTSCTVWEDNSEKFRKIMWTEWRKPRKLLNRGSWNSNRKSIAGELEGLWWEEINPSTVSLDFLHRLLITSLNGCIFGGHMKTSGRCVPKLVHERHS